MIGATQTGAFRVINKKMFQSDWNNMGYAISGISYPSYNINLVHASLIRPTKIFASGYGMTANPGLDQPMILNSGYTEINTGSIVFENTTAQTFADFFSGSKNIMIGYYNMDAIAQYADTFISFYTNGTIPVYENNTANDVYCYLSLGFYLTPQA
jgi:hypothetical protein